MNKECTFWETGFLSDLYPYFYPFQRIFHHIMQQLALAWNFMKWHEDLEKQGTQTHCMSYDDMPNTANPEFESHPLRQQKRSPLVGGRFMLIQGGREPTCTWQTKEASPQCGVPKASDLSLLARNEHRARSKRERRRLSERGFESQRKLNSRSSTLWRLLLFA